MAITGGSKKAKGPTYNICRWSHAGTCQEIVVTCYGYGSLDHFVRDCPNKGGGNTEQSVQIVHEAQLEKRSGVAVKLGTT